MNEFKIVDNWNSIKNDILIPYVNNKTLKSKSIKRSKKELYKIINEKLELPLYQHISNQSIFATIKYIFYKIRSGIFISIKDNKIEAFIPFANKNYINNWSNNIKLYGTKNNEVKEYIKNKRKYVKVYGKYIFNLTKWWANAFIINNEIREDGSSWGQHSLNEYYDMIEETLIQHKVNNCVFIINKRDGPLLHKDLLEPYPNLFKQDKNGKIPNITDTRLINDNYVPILSPYTNKDYMDIPCCIPQNWMLANESINYYIVGEHDFIKWNDKIETAMWRGSATGSMELEFNQRLQLTKLDNDLKNNDPTLLDAGIVSWNSRDKIDSNLQINYIKPNEMIEQGISLKERIPMNEQLKYKYLINVDGHSATNRLSYLLKCGSLLLMVESRFVVGDQYWYSHLLIPFEHYIPIKFDLSDLVEQIKWCRENDDKCKQIMENAVKFYNKYLTKEGIMKYTAYMLNSISSKYV
jgi:hypothetical protein